MGDKMLVNVNSYNHYLGYLWIKNLFPEKEWYLTDITDNHIDGSIVQLNNDTFLVNPNYSNVKKYLPSFMHDKKFIFPYDITADRIIDDGTDIGIQLASERGMDINVLSVSDKRVVVNENAVGTIKALEDNGFDVIPVRLRHSEIFAGGIHCSTLDLLREA
jgi:glycine amidinotransferase